MKLEYRKKIQEGKMNPVLNMCVHQDSEEVPKGNN